MKIQVVVGAQFGSEAKGHVTQQLIKRARSWDEPVVNVRVAGPNAGHCVVDASGRKWAMRQVPVGFVEDQSVMLVIAAGSEIDLPVLLAEIDAAELAGYDLKGRLVVDGEATMLYEQHKHQETQHDLTCKVGSTGKGIGAARADRIMRSAVRLKDDNQALRELRNRGVTIGNTARWLDQDDVAEPTIIIEGTQGYGLGLHAGFYPQCTSSDARAIDFLAMAGVNPWHRSVESFEVWAVARVYPIRVAGNSGPLKGETTWDALGLPEEHTTVTQKVRRVGEWDAGLVHDAVRANGGAPVVRLALTMADQAIPGLKGMTHETFWDLDDAHDDIAQDLVDLMGRIQDDADAQIDLITTSESTCIWRDNTYLAKPLILEINPDTIDG